MAKKTNKVNKKLDVHVNFDEELSLDLRAEAKKERRSYAQLIKYIVADYFSSRAELP